MPKQSSEANLPPLTPARAERLSGEQLADYPLDDLKYLPRELLRKLPHEIYFSLPRYQFYPGEPADFDEVDIVPPTVSAESQVSWGEKLPEIYSCIDEPRGGIECESLFSETHNGVSLIDSRETRDHSLGSDIEYETSVEVTSTEVNKYKLYQAWDDPDTPACREAALVRVNKYNFCEAIIAATQAPRMPLPASSSWRWDWSIFGSRLKQTQSVADGANRDEFTLKVSKETAGHLDSNEYHGEYAVAQWTIDEEGRCTELQFTWFANEGDCARLGC